MSDDCMMNINSRFKCVTCTRILTLIMTRNSDEYRKISIGRLVWRIGGIQEKHCLFSEYCYFVFQYYGFANGSGWAGDVDVIAEMAAMELGGRGRNPDESKIRWYLRSRFRLIRNFLLYSFSPHPAGTRGAHRLFASIFVILQPTRSTLSLHRQGRAYWCCGMAFLLNGSRRYVQALARDLALSWGLFSSLSKIRGAGICPNI